MFMNEDIKKDTMEETKTEFVQENEGMKKDPIVPLKWYQKKPVWIGTAAVAGVAIVGLVATLCLPKSALVVNAQEVELGNKVKLTKKALLNTDEMDAEVVNAVKISSDLMTNTKKYTYDEKTGEVTSKDNSYLDAGTYTVTLTYGDEKEDVKIKVEDTKAPKFVGFKKTITVEQNAEGFDLSRYYLAEDKSDVSVKEEKKTDISKATTVKNSVVGVDEFENESKKECEIKVVNQEDIKNGTKLTPMVDGNVPLSKDTLEKAKSGEIDVQVEEMDKKLAKAYSDIQEDKVNGTTSFKKVKNEDNYFNREKFTTVGNISMESLGMDYKEYREFVNTYLLDEEGHVKGTYNPETNTFDGVDKDGNSFSISAGGLGIQPGEVKTPAEMLEYIQQQQNNGSQSSKPSKPNTGNNGNTGSNTGGNTGNTGNTGGNTGGNSGGSTTPSQPQEPTQPDIPACDNTIPAGFWANRADAEAYAQKVIMDKLLSGEASHGGYIVDIYRTGCGTKYYGITFK